MRKGQGEAQAAGPHVHGLGCHQVFWFKIPAADPFVQNNSTEHTPQRGAACGSYVAQIALFRHITAREARDQIARQPAGHYGKWPNWANALEQPPARLRGGVAPGPAGLGLGPGRTEKRSLGRGPR